MKSVGLNTNWSVTVGDDSYNCDLPHDATACAARDYACAFGELNGYVPSTRAVFTHGLPRIKNGGAMLVISGACGYGEVFVDDEKIGTMTCRGPHTFFVNEFLGGDSELRIELLTSPEMSDKYVGLGIAGGVELVVYDSPVGIEYGSMFVKTANDGDKTFAVCEITLFNRSDKTEKFVLDCAVTNARGKRAGKKQRKVVLRAGSDKKLEVRVRLNRAYEWSPCDPYMYTMTAKLLLEDGSEPSNSVRFGIVARKLSKTRGLYVNGQKTLLYGAYLSHADAAIGGASNYSNEMRRLAALKDIGYNAVHFVDCPTDAALDACDDAGMYAFVDLFDHLVTGKAPLSGLFGDNDVGAKVERLRNHPSVVMYGVADDVPECYNRNDGHAFIGSIADYVRELDPTRPITVSAHEFVPNARELESVGCKKRRFDDAAAAINAGREHNLFDELTAGAFEKVDVCGFNYLDPLYETEKKKRDRLIVGARTSSERAFESLDATEKNDRVIGDFNDCGMDYPGGGRFNEILCVRGDIDAIGCEKPQAVYKRILLGARNIAYIVAVDPDTGEELAMWNWPRHLGQKIQVKVYTSGDVVALYAGGRLVGRKLAGKINKHVASFYVDFVPGTLEAIAYFKGTECARATLASAGTPKAVKLSAFGKNLSVSRGDLGFVRVEVCDKEGLLVPYAMRSLTASVEGGELVNFINADPLLRKSEHDVCPAYLGRALAVVRPYPDEAKAVVKISGDGLASSRISFKIKD